MTTAAVYLCALVSVAAANSGTDELFGVAAPADNTIIQSRDPVRVNDTVVSVAPNFAGAAAAVSLCSPMGSACVNVPALRAAAGVVHWVLPADKALDEFTYSISGGPKARLNAAQPWWFQSATGAAIAPATTLRVFGKSMAFDLSKKACAPYASAAGSAQLRLTPSAADAAPTILLSSSASCWDAAFALPASLKAGTYKLEVKSNLPSATWQTARDPDQHTATISAKATNCSSTGPTHAAHDRGSLLAALAAANKTRSGATVALAAGTITMRANDMLVLPQCVTFKGMSMGKTLLRWGDGKSIKGGSNCHNSNKPLIGADEAGSGAATVSDLAVEVVGLKGCGGVVGSAGGAGLALKRLNISMLADVRTQSVFASLIQLGGASNFLIEGCRFLHCGNNTPGDGHAGVNSPIVLLTAAHDGVIRNNFMQVGLSGWHLDKTWHVIQEGNTYTGYFDDDKSRPLPNFDGSFWFSSYGQGPFPGAGRFFYANTTQNERPHTKPQVGGGESFTLDGGNDGGFYGDVQSIHQQADTWLSDLAAAAPAGESTSMQLTLSGDVCWRHVGGYTLLNCSTAPGTPGGKTGHAIQILDGPGAGQWRRVVSVSGARNRTVALDAPFDPVPVPGKSKIQIGQMRGQLLIVWRPLP